MFDAMSIAATAMRAHQSEVDAIAHNVANLNTTGFRRSVVSFSEATAALTAADTASATTATQSTASQLASFVRGAGVLAHESLSTAVGELKQTNQPLDVGIDGIGFLEVVRADGSPAYTRAGALAVNPDGVLALLDGTPLAGRILVPPDAKEIHIAADGQITAAVADQKEPLELGRIELVSFANPAALASAGGNLFVATSASGEARPNEPGVDGLGSLRQGYLESSNVQLIEEMVSMMLAQRAFELDGRVVQAADQMMAITNGLYRS
jgi:flagellar basal-body rod protein FlgG